ncbi:MAG: D-alanine--D-alanine ligase [Chitinophagia bacterium]|jgi:D-alanine-D-alanine ligase|nr:D-alanine--D-alanine ligase [Chitinophagia bacterium]
MKKKVALVTGGLSSEAQISYKSAKNVFAALDKNKYDVFMIDIHPTGWWYENNAGEEVAVDKADFSIVEHGQKINFDVALMCIHGTPGEDGKMQGYFDLIGLPYTSCDTSTSALTFNKRFTVAVAGFGGVGVAKSLHLFKAASISPNEILQQLQLPVFVKPNNGGSSLGISKVNKVEELSPALEKAFKEDTQVLVEEFISGREFTIGVFKSRGATTVLPITEIITENEFFDFEAKYLGKSKEVTPALITEKMKEDLSVAAQKVYAILNCRGVVRIDFIYNEAQAKPYMLEVNTVPGQSDASVIPQQVRSLGWTLTDFYGQIIEDALLK